MKHCLFIIILFVLLAGCSDNTVTVKSSYDQGVSLAGSGEFEAALEAFTKASRNEADKYAAQESLEVINKSLSHHLDKQAAIEFFKGIKAGNRGEQLLAFSYFSNAIKAAPDFANAYYERGIINGRLKLYEQAIADFSRSIELNPQDSVAYNNRGLARAKGLQQYKESIADFTAAVDLDPQFAEAYDNRALAYRMAGDDRVKACADWKRACDLNRCDGYNRARQNGYCQ